MNERTRERSHLRAIRSSREHVDLASLDDLVAALAKTTGLVATLIDSLPYDPQVKRAFEENVSFDWQPRVGVKEGITRTTRRLEHHGV